MKPGICRERFNAPDAHADARRPRAWTSPSETLAVRFDRRRTMRSASQRAVTRAIDRARRTLSTEKTPASALWSSPRPVDTPSRDYDEALRRGRALYRDVCREIPWVMDNYSMNEVTTATKLRRAVKDVMRAKIEELEMKTRPENRANALDIALWRAREELIALEAHHYQRHHLITRFVNPRAVNASKAKRSAFVDDFLSGGRIELH
jgi:NADH dehydrogenase (ubiquinone) 1 alpha subcomplex subunit 6